MTVIKFFLLFSFQPICPSLCGSCSFATPICLLSLYWSYSFVALAHPSFFCRRQSSIAHRTCLFTGDNCLLYVLARHICLSLYWDDCRISRVLLLQIQIGAVSYILILEEQSDTLPPRPPPLRGTPNLRLRSILCSGTASISLQLPVWGLLEESANTNVKSWSSSGNL